MTKIVLGAFWTPIVLSFLAFWVIFYWFSPIFLPIFRNFGILGILKSEKQKKKVFSLKKAEKCFFCTIFALALFGVFSSLIWRVQCQKIWEHWRQHSLSRLGRGCYFGMSNTLENSKSPPLQASYWKDNVSNICKLYSNTIKVWNTPILSPKS